MSVRHLVLQHLAAGMSQENAARAVGVSSGLVSQLLADPDFKAEVNRAKAAKAKDARAEGTAAGAEHDIAYKLDGTYDSLEMAVLGKLGNMIAKENYPWRPAELAGIVKTLNSARRRQGPLSNVATPQSQVNVTNTVVQLNLPAAMQKTYLQPDFVIDPGKNQVVEVNGRRLDTLNSKLLLSAGTAEQRKARLLASAMAHSNNQASEPHNEDPYDSTASASHQSKAPAATPEAALALLANEHLNTARPSNSLAKDLEPAKLRGLTADDF